MSVDSITKELISANKFDSKNSYEATRNLVSIRSESYKKKEKEIDESDPWKKRPLDFTWKLYHPNPPKRNSRESMKPWKYDDKSTFVKPNLHEMTAEEYIRMLSKEFNVEKLTEKDVNYSKTNSNENLSDSSEDFFTRFRCLTPNSARMEAAKSMGYRSGLEQYKIPKSYDHRPLTEPRCLGIPEFKTRFEADPYNIKHLSENLRIINGLPAKLRFPLSSNGVQMGDSLLKQDAKYLPNLVLPRLPFPNRFHGYTRYRRRDRSVESAYWERMLDKINDKWDKEKKKK